MCGHSTYIAVFLNPIQFSYCWKHIQIKPVEIKPCCDDVGKCIFASEEEADFRSRESIEDCETMLHEYAADCLLPVLRGDVYQPAGHAAGYTPVSSHCLPVSCYLWMYQMLIVTKICCARLKHTDHQILVYVFCSIEMSKTLLHVWSIKGLHVSFQALILSHNFCLW